MTGRRDGPLAAGVFALLFSLYLLTFSGAYHASDEMAMLVATDSLARRGAWDIELLRWMGEQQGSFGPDGHLYSRKGIGTTLAALPLYWLALHSPHLGNVQTAMLLNGVVTALTGALVYLFLRRLGYGRRSGYGQGVSLVTALAFGVGTMAWPYARYLFSESPAGLGILFSAYFLMRYRDGQDRGRGSGYVSLVLAGGGLGLALLARLNNGLVAPFLGLILLSYLLRRHPSRRGAWWLGPVVLFCLPVLAALGISGWYNWIRFGSPLVTGYLPEEQFSTRFFEGLYGLTFSPGKGLFWYNPILLAALIAWPAFLRRHRAEALLATAVVLANMAFYAPWYLWWAGHSWGPRFLVAVLPFAVLPLAPVVEAAAHRRRLALALAALAALSVAIQLLGVAVNFNLYLEEVYAELGLYHPATLFHPAYSPLLRQAAYLRPANLDLAWAQRWPAAWPALLAGAGMVGASVAGLWAAWRARLPAGAGAGLLLLLALGTVISLWQYAPTGALTSLARNLAAMERRGEAAVLTELDLTAGFQDAYDGRLALWGVPGREGVGGDPTAVWVLGSGTSDSAAARFQNGPLRLELYLPPGQRFDLARLPIGQPHMGAQLGATIELATFQVAGTTVRQGGRLPVTLYWRALGPIDASYTAFVQLVDDQGGKAGQVDRPPCDGGCPTNVWQPGDLIGEWVEIPVSDDAPPGQYQLIAGMYKLATGEHLLWQDSQGQPTGPQLRLAQIVVEP